MHSICHTGFLLHLGRFEFGRICLAHTGSTWKLMILFSMLQFSLEKLSKLWHENSCFAFCKESTKTPSLNFSYFVLVWCIVVQSLVKTFPRCIYTFFFCSQLACNCSDLLKQELIFQRQTFLSQMSIK